MPEMAAPAEKRGVRELVARLLALPEKYRIVLYLHYLEGYPVKTVAELLGRNQSTVRSQLQRGRQKLKLNLGGEALGQTHVE